MRRTLRFPANVYALWVCLCSSGPCEKQSALHVPAEVQRIDFILIFLYFFLELFNTVTSGTVNK